MRPVACRAESLPQQGAHFCFARGIGQRLDDAAHERDVVAPHAHFEPCDAAPLEAPAVGG